MTLTLRPFHPNDPRRIAPRDDFAAEHAMMGAPLFAGASPEGPAWTLAGAGADVLACGGFAPQGEAAWAGWLFAADLTPRGWALVVRAFRRLAANAAGHRVEVTVRASGPGPKAGARERKARAFAERLGLRPEGLMRGFAPDGTDYWLYAGVF